MRRNIVLSTIVVGCIIVAIEIILRLIGFSNLGSKRLTDFVPKRANPPYRVDETLGWDYIPNWEGEVSGKRVKTNSFGMRDDDFPLQKPEGTIRILLLGDSVTFGLGVDQDSCYGQRLEALMNGQDRPYPCSVLNAGVGSYNTEQEKRWLSEKGLTFEPDIVLVGFVLNDVMYRGIYVFQEQSWFVRLLWRTATYNLLHRVIMNRRAELEAMREEMPRRLMEDTETANELWQECYTHIREMNRICEQDNIPLVFILFPWPNQIEDPDHAAFPQQRLIRYLEELEIPYIDLLRSFQGEGLDAFLKDDTHPSAKGHGIAAQEIFNYLNREFLSDPNPERDHS